MYLQTCGVLQADALSAHLWPVHFDQLEKALRQRRGRWPQESSDVELLILKCAEDMTLLAPPQKVSSKLVEAGNYLAQDIARVLRETLGLLLQTPKPRNLARSSRCPVVSLTEYLGKAR